MRFRPGMVSSHVVVPEDDYEADYVDKVPEDSSLALDCPVGTRIFKLPHQCDSWIIGTKDDVRALIHELQEAIK